MTGVSDRYDTLCDPGSIDLCSPASPSIRPSGRQNNPVVMRASNALRSTLPFGFNGSATT